MDYEKLWKKNVKSHYSLLCKRVVPREILPYLTCLTDTERETIRIHSGIEAKLIVNQELLDMLLRHLPSSYEDLNAALREPDVGLSDVANTIFGYSPEPEQGEPMNTIPSCSTCRPPPRPVQQPATIKMSGEEIPRTSKRQIYQRQDYDNPRSTSRCQSPPSAERKGEKTNVTLQLDRQDQDNISSRQETLPAAQVDYEITNNYRPSELARINGATREDTMISAPECVETHNLIPSRITTAHTIATVSTSDEVFSASSHENRTEHTQCCAAPNSDTTAAMQSPPINVTANTVFCVSSGGKIGNINIGDQSSSLDDSDRSQNGDYTSVQEYEESDSERVPCEHGQSEDETPCTEPETSVQVEAANINTPLQHPHGTCHELPVDQHCTANDEQLEGMLADLSDRGLKNVKRLVDQMEDLSIEQTSDNETTPMKLTFTSLADNPGDKDSKSNFERYELESCFSQETFSTAIFNQGDNHTNDLNKTRPLSVTRIADEETNVELISSVSNNASDREERNTCTMREMLTSDIQQADTVTSSNGDGSMMQRQSCQDEYLQDDGPSSETDDTSSDLSAECTLTPAPLPYAAAPLSYGELNNGQSLIEILKRNMTVLGCTTTMAIAIAVLIWRRN